MSSNYLVPITDEMKRAALHYEEAIKKTVTLSRKTNFTGLEADRRYYYGFIGELAFKTALEKEKRFFEHHVRTDGMPEPYKFKIIKAENLQNIKTNVCTASKATHKYLAVPKEKLHHAHVDVYIGAKVLDGEQYVQLYGYITASELYKLGADTLPGQSMPCYRCALVELKPIEQLFERIK